MKIKSVHAREIISTSSNPTIEVKITLEDGTVGVSAAPYGSSEGTHEPLKLMDGDPNRYFGKGMLKAVANVNDIIQPALIGVDVSNQELIDKIMIDLDGTQNFSKLGGNAITGVSLACARTASKAHNMELFEYLRPMFTGIDKEYKFPQPMMVLIEGGEHADDSTDLQEYLIVCRTENFSISDKVREGIEVYQTLGKVLKEKGYNINVGFEGAYAPTKIQTNQEPFELMSEAIKRCGYKIGEDIALALDAAASEILENGVYHLARENRELSASDMVSYYEELINKYHIVSIEDGLGEDDWDNWIKMNTQLSSKIMVMGDDLTVTNRKKLAQAIDKKSANSILIKPNQAGTLSELIGTINLARANNFKVVISHRGGGDTADTFIADLSVASNADMIKCGPSRSERTEKYNRLMEIDEILKTK